MAQFVSISANPRTTTGKGAARQLRFQKKVPAVIYGHGRASQSLELDAKDLEKALTGIEPASTLFELTLDGRRIARPPADGSPVRPMACVTPAACSIRSRGKSKSK